MFPRIFLIMVRSAHNRKDRFQLFTELDEEYQIALANTRNVNHDERHANVIGHDFLTERGRAINGLDSTTIPVTIEHRNWSHFTSTPAKYHPELVCKFYVIMVPEVFKDSSVVLV